MARKVLIFLMAMLLMTSGLIASEKYKKYKRTQTRDYLLKVSFSEDQIIMTIFGDGHNDTILFNPDDVRLESNVVYINNVPVLDKRGLLMGDDVYSPDLIDRLDVKIDEDRTEIYFIKQADQSFEKFRRRKKNRISWLKNISIDSETFVRGAVVSLWSDIEISGEINEDVVALFGNIKINDSAVIRGDVAAINGKIEISDEAAVYGEILSSRGRHKIGFKRWSRWRHGETGFSLIGKFRYNRVDGAAPYLGQKYSHKDSLLPEIEAYGGYAFASERWRWFLGIEYSILKKRPVTIGGSFYRRLASPDDWLISETENTFFTLLFTEDFKDYYEAEGGYGFVRFTPFAQFNFEVGVRTEKLKWLRAHRNLWSLFGGSKRFPLNFSTVADIDRPAMIDTIDGRRMTSIQAIVRLDSRDEDDIYGSSFWKGTLSAELAPDSWNDNFDFSRLFARLVRYQKLTRKSGLQISALAAGSGNELPVHKKFFLGGLGTFYGYNRRELIGVDLWYLDLGYRLEIPRTSAAGWLFYNVGQVADYGVKIADAEVKHSLGIGLSVENDLRISLARRLDRSDASIRFQATLSLHF